MKKIKYLGLALGCFLVVSCSDNTTEKSSTTSDTTTTTPPAPKQEYAAPPSKDNVEVKKDTPRTEISVGKDGAAVKTKKGTGVSVDKKGVKVGSKDVKIDIKTDSL